MTVAVSGDNITFPDNSVQATAPKVGMVNRIINGAMVIDQRNAGASVTPTASAYTLDRWEAGMSAASKFSVQRSTTAPAGFTNSLLATSTSAYTVTTSQTFNLTEFIEGFNVADMGFGTASAQTFTLSFQVRSSLTGTFGGAFQNSDRSRSYPFTFTISAANTFETKTVTVAGDTSGTWLTDNGRGLNVIFSLGAGATLSGTAGAWASATYYSATGATSVVGTSGATFYITGIDLRKGSTGAYSNGQNDFDYRPYGTELGLCQRYYQTINKMMGIGQSGSAVTLYAVVEFPVAMRTTPTLGQSGVFSFEIPFGTSSTQSSTNINFASGNNNTGIYIFMQNFSGLTGGQIYMKNANTNLLLLTAEL